MSGKHSASVHSIAEPVSGKTIPACFHTDVPVYVALGRIFPKGIPKNVRAVPLKTVLIQSIAVCLFLPVALATTVGGAGIEDLSANGQFASEHCPDGCFESPQPQGLQGIRFRFAGLRAPNQPELKSPELEFPVADLQGARLWKVNLQGADLQGADLQGADLRGAKLQGADLRGADLRWADLREVELGGADLRGADLRGADLRGAGLQGVDLRGADLQGADLQGADLRDARLQLARMQEAVLLEADTSGANFSSALLVSTDLSTNKKLTQAQIDSAFGDSSTSLPEHLTRPDRWPEERVAPHEIYDRWRAWLRNR